MTFEVAFELIGTLAPDGWRIIHLYYLHRVVPGQGRSFFKHHKILKLINKTLVDLLLSADEAYHCKTNLYDERRKFYALLVEDEWLATKFLQNIIIVVNLNGQ